MVTIKLKRHFFKRRAKPAASTLLTHGKFNGKLYELVAIPGLDDPFLKCAQGREGFDSKMFVKDEYLTPE